MAEVNVTINGRTFGIACDDGQEQRVLDLSKYVDERVKEISKAGAANNESHLMVLTSLILADEVFDLLENEGAKSAGNDTNNEDNQKYINAIEYLAQRIEKIAGNLQTA